MHLSWNELRARAEVFARKWKDASDENRDTQTFYNEFFQIFDVKRESVARYEVKVRKLDDTRGRIDLLWPGLLLVEQKSAGRNLESAYEQAGEYFDGLTEKERPEYILVSDFRTFRLSRLATGEVAEFRLSDLKDHIDKFSFLLGRERRTFRDQHPINVAAAELVGRLHDALETSGYTGHDLERFLVRLVFCLFADDTGIFEPRDLLIGFIENRTREDGADLGPLLSQLFEVLDTPEDRRLENLDEAQGAHYTTEKNILKVVEPLFLDDLRAEFDRLRARKDGRRAFELRRFQKKLGELTFFDPACGCGNFLVIAYRELRLLELAVLKELYAGRRQLEVLVDRMSVLDVDQFYGIEIGEFPVRIAETALWMMDHIMNNQLSLEFGQTYTRIPLAKSPNIVHGDALEMDWAEVLPQGECDFVFGNPPFVGKSQQSPEQAAQVRRVAELGKQGGTLDYVAAWFIKAGAYVSQAGKPVRPTASAGGGAGRRGEALSSIPFAGEYGEDGELPDPSWG